MDSVDYFHSAVTEQTVLCDVYRDADGTSYSDDDEQVGQAAVVITDASHTSETVTEGSDESVSYIGRLLPKRAQSSETTVTVQLNDELRHQNGPRQYIVRTKTGRPNDIAPDMWELGLERANSV